ncbi:MAG: zinc-binding dehydrogenase, partial [Nitrospiraceae bacterium]
MPWYIENKAPLVLGHEPSGEIVRTGINVDFFKAGNRVFIHHHAPCMNCVFCRRGDYVQCSQWRRSGIIPGGISEYLRIPEGILKNDTLKLSDSMSYEDGTLVEPTACVVKSFRRSAIKKGDTVLVIGLGVMGILHILLAPHYGAEKVIGADMNDFRLDKAMEAGASAVINVDKESIQETIMSMTNGKGADIVIAGPNSVEAVHNGFQCAAPGGTVVMFTPLRPDEALTLNANDMYFKDIRLVPAYSCGPDDTREAFGLIDQGIVSAEKLVTHRYNIEETAKAYRKVASAGESLKVLITFENGGGGP